MKKAFSFFILLSMLCWFLTSNSAHALDIPRDCSDLEMLQQKWETQYFYDLKFNGYLKNGIPPLKCDSLPYKFVKAIWAIENLKTSPEFGNIYEQLKTHVREFQIIPLIGLPDPVTNKIVSMRGNTDTSKGKISVYLPAFSEIERKETYVWNDKFYIRNLFRLITTIIHELRHLENPVFKHVDCPDSEEHKGCDSEYTDNIQIASPYSIEILYLRDILQQNPFSESDYELLLKDSHLIRRNSFLDSVSE